MEFLKSNKRFSFLYDGKSFEELKYSTEQSENGNELVTVYTFADGLKITNIAKKHGKFGAYEWVNWLENTSDTPTGIISELWDCDAEFSAYHAEEFRNTAYFYDPDKVTKIYSPSGSTWDYLEFYSDPTQMTSRHFKGFMFKGKINGYSNSSGRSSENKAPFFNINTPDGGIIMAIGWSGHWNCHISRFEDSVRLQSKINDTNFKLLPGEKIRTSSVVVMPYTGNYIDSQNKWRRLVKEEFSLIGKPGRPKTAPFCAGMWGGMTTGRVLEQLKKIDELGLPVEYVWMDAGWYGMDDQPSPDEFEGNWWGHCGDWRINKNFHPDELKDVTAEIQRQGKKFLLWFEPERAMANTIMVKEHPEYFISVDPENNKNKLLNLGDEAAWSYAYNMLSEKIEALNISCMRQDFNCNPLGFWRSVDAEDRQGITEIKYVMGLYRLWDTLLEKFPALIIDNCASGGRRIDIETLRRSVPLWRSDAQCPANFEPEISQVHNMTFSTWLPYSGSGTGREYSEYRLRSCYAGGLTTNYFYSEKDSYCETKEKADLLMRCFREYLKIRPYFYEDVYPLTEPTDRKDVWSAVQFDRPEQNDGVVQVFKRAKSMYNTASFDLYAIKADKKYIFTDADDNSTFEISGKELLEKGLEININEKRKAKIYFYRYV